MKHIWYAVVLRDPRVILTNFTCACVIILFWLIVTLPKKPYALSVNFLKFYPLCARMLQMETFFNPSNFSPEVFANSMKNMIF